VKKSADSDSVLDSRGRHYKLIYSGHRAQGLSTSGRQMWRRCTSQAIVPRRHRRNATTGRCARQQCRGHNHLGQSPERPGHVGQPAATGRRRALQHSTVRSAPRPLNNVLPPSTHDVKRSLHHCTRNATHATSGRPHSLNLSGDMASVKRRTHTQARRRRRRIHPPHRTLHNTKTTHHPPQPAAPPPGRPPPPRRLYQIII